MRTVEVLGPVRVAGEPVTSPAQATLLCVLAAAVPDAVPFHRLVDALWDDPPPSAENSLHSHLTRLRQRLDPGSIVREGNSYRMVAPTDAADFLAVLEPAATEAAGRRRELADALALWRGSPYGDLADHRFVRPSADALITAQGRAVHELAQLSIDAGDPSAAVSLLQERLSTQPLDEGTWARLVEALDASSRTAEALRTVQDAIKALAEVGLEPSSRLLDAERAVLQSGPIATGAAALPRTTGPFVGRAQTLSELHRSLAAPGWVTLVGPGGVGKTRLAAEAASLGDDPVIFCDLTDATGADVEVTIARAAGVPLMPPYLDRVVTRLGRSAALLVLDCCETAAPTIATVGTRLLERCPRLRVLATSRMPLHIGGERLVDVEPLTATDAAELFNDRVVDAGIDPPQADVVQRLCDAVDRLPLTIEMLAGSLRSLAADEMIRAVHDPLRVLGGPEGDLASSVERSVDLLDADERRSFERLAMFHGPFVLDTAAGVLDAPEPDATVVNHLRSLRDRSLLSNVDTESGRRLQMLDTVKAVGREALRAGPEAQEAERNLVATFRRRAIQVDAGLRSPDELRWLAITNSEIADLRAAHRLSISLGDVDAAMTISASMFHLVYDRLRPDIAGWAEETIDAFGDDHPLGATVRAAAGLGAMLTDDHDRSRAHLERARVRFGPNERHVELVAANLGLRSGDLLAASEVSTRAVISDARRVGDLYTETVGHVVHALVTGYEGRTAAALEIAGRARKLSRTVGAPTLHAYVDYVEGEILSETDPDLALDLLRRAYDRAVISSSSLAIGVSLVTITTIQARSTGAVPADEDFHAAIRHWRDLGDWNHQWATLRNYAEYLARTKRDEMAATILGAGDTHGPQAFGAEATRLGEARTSARRRLGDKAYERHWTTGRSLTSDELLEYALAAGA